MSYKPKNVHIYHKNAWNTLEVLYDSEELVDYTEIEVLWDIWQEKSEPMVKFPNKH